MHCTTASWVVGFGIFVPNRFYGVSGGEGVAYLGWTLQCKVHGTWREEGAEGGGKAPILNQQRVRWIWNTVSLTNLGDFLATSQGLHKRWDGSVAAVAVGKDNW